MSCVLWSALFALIYMLCLCDAQSEHLSSRTVTTKYGALRGFIVRWPASRTARNYARNVNSTKSASNSFVSQLRPVEVFLGVPYATGKLNMTIPPTIIM